MIPSNALLAAAVLALLAPVPARADLRIVATVPGLAAIAKELAGDRGTVVSLSLPTQDPHFVDARPNLLVDLNRADLLLAVGVDLEAGWLPPLLSAARNPALLPGGRGHLDCSRFVELRDVPVGKVDRSQGDIHPGGNPHYLYDPRAGAALARGIAARMADLDPDRAAEYRTRLAALLERLEAVRVGWEEKLAPLRGTEVVGYHKSWAYLVDWLGWTQVGFVEPKPGVPPSPAHAAQLVLDGRRRGVGIVLQEGYYADTTSRLLAEKMGARLVKVPGGPDFRGGESYVEWVGRIAALVEAAARERRGP